MFLFRPTDHDLERLIRQRPLQTLRLIRRRALPEDRAPRSSGFCKSKARLDLWVNVATLSAGCEPAVCSFSNLIAPRAFNECFPNGSLIMQVDFDVPAADVAAIRVEAPSQKAALKKEN